jgi:superkiller protein 3
LTETKSAPDVVCALAQVLWAKGGARERKVAKEQLFEAFSASAGAKEGSNMNISPVLMLGAMAVIEQPPDLNTAKVVYEELLSIQLRKGLPKNSLDEIHLILGAIEDTIFATKPAAKQFAAQRSIMLLPGSPDSWARLADVSEPGTDAAPATMALRLASRMVPPRGIVSAARLARAFARTGNVADAQRAIMIKPGDVAGWKALMHGVEILRKGADGQPLGR